MIEENQTEIFRVSKKIGNEIKTSVYTGTMKEHPTIQDRVIIETVKGETLSFWKNQIWQGEKIEK